MNSTQIAVEKGVDAVPCVSGWCGKIIESQNLNNGEHLYFILDMSLSTMNVLNNCNKKYAVHASETIVVTLNVKEFLIKDNMYTIENGII